MTYCLNPSQPHTSYPSGITKTLRKLFVSQEGEMWISHLFCFIRRVPFGHIRVDPAKIMIHAMVNLPVLTNRKILQNFLGISNFYHSHWFHQGLLQSSFPTNLPNFSQETFTVEHLCTASFWPSKHCLLWLPFWHILVWPFSSVHNWSGCLQQVIHGTFLRVISYLWHNQTLDGHLLLKEIKKWILKFH